MNKELLEKSQQWINTLMNPLTKAIPTMTWMSFTKGRHPLPFLKAPSEPRIFRGVPLREPVDLLIVEKSRSLLRHAIEVKELQQKSQVSFWGVKGCYPSDLAFLNGMGFFPDVQIADDLVEDWIKPIEDCVKKELYAVGNKDGSHDFGHFQRVSALSRRFAQQEFAHELVAFAAGMLHDIVNLPKNHPQVSKCSLFAAARAQELLLELNFPAELIPNVCHAIHAHSFSAKIETKTPEAQCVQDADRMEALGAFGLMRVFYVSGTFRSQLMDEKDPAGNNRKLDDKTFALDHFVQKLFTLQETMKTKAGRQTAESLTTFLKDFRDGIISDHLEGNKTSGRFKIAETYYRAGPGNSALFHSTDPFAEKGRILEPDQYALDGLLTSDDAYISTFIDQLRFELNGYQSNHLVEVLI